jgi:mRNA guanylyltransferase
VCEKSDGIRYLLYFTADQHGNECHYLIDRKNDFWFIHQQNLHFPTAEDHRQFHVDTLIDGELVMDDVGNGRKEPRFLVFDCLVLDRNKDLLTRPLDKRLGYFQEHVMKPYKELFRQYPEELAKQAFKVEMKDMQVGYAMEKMFNEVIPSVRHGNDGLIFTCRGTPYHFGTDPHILKWKPATENTIDFKMRIMFRTVDPDEIDLAEGITERYVDWEGYQGVPDVELDVWLGNGPEPYRYFANLYLTEEEWETLKGLGDPLQDRIVECAQDEQKRWRLHRFRDDKHTANHVSTVESVMESIVDSVSQEELMEAADSIKAAWKARAARPR